jgi:hypothetical protein
MVGELYAGIGAFKAMFDMAKSLKDINDATIRNAAIVELQEKILAAQTTQSELAQRVRELEEEVTRFDKWDTEKERYYLVHAIAGGSMVYALKPESQGAATPHWICASCYPQRKKGILQRAESTYGMWMYRCPLCKNGIIAHWESYPQPNTK